MPHIPRHGARSIANVPLVDTTALECLCNPLLRELKLLQKRFKPWIVAYSRKKWIALNAYDSAISLRSLAFEPHECLVLVFPPGINSCKGLPPFERKALLLNKV